MLDILTKGDTENSSDLYWDSWDSYHLRKEICPKSILFRTRCSIPSESRILFHNNNDALPTASASLTLSSLPCISSLLKQECGKYEEKMLILIISCVIFEDCVNQFLM